MRPLRLTMTAFGPYKDKVVIDFNDLQGNQLFVISGNTGAGKTTIFDGICFALYGSASGQDRENNAMLRSQFAADDTHTSVELEFELNGRFYRIRRQLGHVKKGNKTKTGEQYEFFENVNGQEYPCVDRQMVSEIDKKVEALIGLTQDQFKQIVMLPQGEFRKLLTSQTENKEDILRRLFKTEPYKQISERLRQKKELIAEGFSQEKQTRDTYIQNIWTALPEREHSSLFQLLREDYYNVNQVLSALSDETAFYQEQIKQDQEAYEKAYQAHDEKQTAFHAAKGLNERFQELEEKETTLQELEKQGPIHAEKEKQFARAEQANKLEPYEKQVMDWQRDEQEKTKELQEAEKALQTADQAVTSCLSVYETEEKKKDEREEVRKKLDRLNTYLPIVKEMNEQKQQLQKLEQQEKHTAGKVTEAQHEKAAKKKQLDADQETIHQLDQSLSKLPDKQQQLQQLREQCRVLDRYLKCQANQQTLEQTREQKKQVFEQQNKAYRELEKTWLNNQAVVLAGHLHDGEACPVCGSHEHPSKATVAKDGVSKEQIENKKVERDSTETAYRNALAEEKANKEQLEVEKQEVLAYDIFIEQAAEVRDQVVADGKVLSAEVEKLQASRTKLQELKESQKKLQQQWDELNEKEEKRNREHQDIHTSYQKAAAVYQERLKQVPEEVQDLAVLEKHIHDTKKLKQELEQAWETAQTKLQQAREEQTKAATNSEQVGKQLEETKFKREQAKKQFDEILAEIGFSTVEEYQNAKLSEEKQQQLKNDIESYKQQFSTVKQQVTELREFLKDKQKADLTALEEQLQELKKSYETALHKRDESKNYYQEASRLRGNIADTHEKMRDTEQQLSTITDLYDVLRGQNSQKISFERYLQIEYLDQIIESANQRLHRLSNGQFLLIRSERQESHGRQSGLGLDVYDAYTGLTRDVKTLSGGEKFNASLCLALGMSDVIQSFQGNISIETMFIDEGFGSLDEESLHKAIDALIDLQQSGRMIGVISHVQELKNLFPAVLEVHKTKEGHSHTSFVVK